MEEINQNQEPLTTLIVLTLEKTATEQEVPSVANVSQDNENSKKEAVAESKPNVSQVAVRYNWDSLWEEFKSGKDKFRTLSDFARYMGVDPDNGTFRDNSKHWLAERENYWANVAEEAEKRAKDLIIETTAQIKRNNYVLAKNLMKALEGLFLERGEDGTLNIVKGLKAGTLKYLTSALKDIQSIQFSAKGIVERTSRLVDERATPDELLPEEQEEVNRLLKEAGLE